jgi:hypothetical protein
MLSPLLRGEAMMVRTFGLDKFNYNGRMCEFAKKVSTGMQ